MCEGLNVSKINEVADRPKLFWALGAALVVVIVGTVVGITALVSSGDGGSDDDRAISGDAAAADDEAASDDTNDVSESGDASDSRSGDQAGDGDGSGGDGSDGDGATTSPGRSDGEASDPRSSDRPRPGNSGPGDSGGNDSGTLPAGEMTSTQICDRVTGDVVSQATGLNILETSPADAAKTPQCRYYFAGADKAMTNATVSVLRPEQDMDGRSGAAAYRHAVDLNRRAAADSGLEVSETKLGVGDESILFENDLLRYGIIRYGDRIVTVILTAPSADHDTAVDLAAATTVLAPA